MGFYHGTRAGFERGGLLLPVDVTAANQRPGHVPKGTAHVYVTTDRDLAEWYALNSKGRARPRILTVQPLGPLTDDASPYDHEHNQFRCEAATVVAVEILTL